MNNLFRRVAIALVGLLFVPALLAQNEVDALRISTSTPGGTGRSTGLANAFGALGADPVAAGINPAGFGLYRTSELSVTPMVEVNGVTSTAYGTQAVDSKTTFVMNNLALILNNPSKGGDWRSGTFGVVYDRQQSNNWRTASNAENVPSTFLEGMALDADGIRSDELFDALPFTAGLAWETYAINLADPNDTLGTTYYPAIPFGSLTTQVHTVQSKGASANTTFFYSGNYMDRVYLGLSLGLASHRLSRTTTHSETSEDGSLDLENATWTEDLSTTGNGVNVKVGVIGRITDRFRMGLAYHSPQWMQLTDAYVTSMATQFRTPDAFGTSRYIADSPESIFGYQVNTPWRLVGSAAYVAGDHGLVSVDYEYHDPRGARFRPADEFVNSYDFQSENTAIVASFTPVHTVRAGTEWRFSNWYYRLGWSIVTNPYKTTDSRRGDALKNYAAGIGYRTDHLAVDLGMNHALQQSSTYPYYPDLVEATVEDRRSTRFILTVSLRP